MKRRNIHTYKSVINVLKKFQLPTETYDDAVNRLMDLEDKRNPIISFTEEYVVEYNNISRSFKIVFNSHKEDEVYFYDPYKKVWSSDVRVWENGEDKSIIKYLIMFISSFLADSKNFVMLEMMGSSTEYNDVVIRRV